MSTIEKCVNRFGKLWLNVGSGRYPLSDFVNLDNSVWLLLMPFEPILCRFLSPKHLDVLTEYKLAKKQGRYVFHDCRKPLNVSNNSVDHILCSHFLEHVYPNEMCDILRDFNRALKPGGTCHIIVPNLNFLINEYTNKQSVDNGADRLIAQTLLSHKRKPTWNFRFLEFLGYEGLKHRWMYDTKSMSVNLRDAGFELLAQNESPSKEVRANDQDASVNLLGMKPR